MFNIPIRGEIDGRDIAVYLRKRYGITANGKYYEGVLAKCDKIDEKFLIKTVNGGYWILFSEIDNIEKV